MIRMPQRNITTERISKSLFKLTVLFQIALFVSLGGEIYIDANLPYKGMLDDPRIGLELDILTALFLFSVTALAIIYSCRFVRWRNHRKSN
jgi:hypothetical protein